MFAIHISRRFPSFFRLLDWLAKKYWLLCNGLCNGSCIHFEFGRLAKMCASQIDAKVTHSMVSHKSTCHDSKQNQAEHSHLSLRYWRVNHMMWLRCNYTNKWLIWTIVANVRRSISWQTQKHITYIVACILAAQSNMQWAWKVTRYTHAK